MHVEKILPEAQERLVTVSEYAALVEAAKRLSGPDANLVVVCDGHGFMRGVVSKTDIVNRISHCAGASCTRPVASVMTRQIVSCRPGDTLRAVWDVMKARGLKHVPVADARPCPRHPQCAGRDAGSGRGVPAGGGAPARLRHVPRLSLR